MSREFRRRLLAGNSHTPPEQDSMAIAKLCNAGAIVLGKTNLDQFATGLNGTRSPYGAPRSVFNAAYIPRGSSSGSPSLLVLASLFFTWHRYRRVWTRPACLQQSHWSQTEHWPHQRPGIVPASY
jgi:Amidase